MRHLASVLLFLLLTGRVTAGTPPPPPTPVEPMPAGDPSVTLPPLTPEPTPEPAPVEPMPAGDPSVVLPEPTATPEPTAAPEQVPTLAPGAAELAVRVCIDLDADNACGATEGIQGVPVVIFDASTGDMLADGKTNEQGTYRAPVAISEGMDLSAAAPPLGLSSQIWDTRRGVVLLLSDVPIVPARLP